MSEENPQFSVTFRDNKNNASLTVNYDTDIEFRRGCVSLANDWLHQLRKVNMPTKAQLESEIARLESVVIDKNSKLAEKSESLNKLNNELQRAKNEVDRQLGNARDADAKLKSICRVIASTLAVKYDVGTSNDYDITKDRQPEEVRLLRHLFELADTSLPF